MSEHESLPNAR